MLSMGYTVHSRVATTPARMKYFPIIYQMDTMVGSILRFVVEKHIAITFQGQLIVVPRNLRTLYPPHMGITRLISPHLILSDSALSKFIFFNVLALIRE